MGEQIKDESGRLSLSFQQAMRYKEEGNKNDKVRTTRRLQDDPNKTRGDGWNDGGLEHKVGVHPSLYVINEILC